MINELERVVWHFIRAAPFEAAQLGRSESKFVGLISLVKGLPSSKHSFTEGHMHDCIRELAASMQHYGKEPGPRKAPEACARNSDFADSKCEPSVCSTPRSRGLKGTLSGTVAQTRVKSSNPEAPLHPPGLTCPAEPEEREQNEASNAHSLRRPATATLPSGIGYKRVEADRVKWLHPPTFDPNPFLTDPIVKAVFNDPDVLRLPRDQWPRLPPAQVHGTREDILALAEKWDRKQALRLIPVSEIDLSEAVGAFCIPKNTDFDRLILNPTVVNSRCCKYANFTRYLAPGSLACGIHLESGEYLRMCCDDLTDMYYTFAVPHARAKRNSLNMPFQPHEISHFSAFDAKLHSTPCVVALSSLAMGDHMAVEIAQQSHYNVLALLGGSVLPHEFASHRRPVPRGGTLELLAIDDHITLQKVPSRALHSDFRARDTEIFEAAGRAYTQVHLIQHEDKRKRNEFVGSFLGAEMDGVTGFVSAPRHRISVLMLLTAMICYKSVSSPALLSSLLGLWVHVLLFRRPGLALLSASFRDARKQPMNEVIKLSRETVCELQALTWLAPLWVTNLRVDYAPHVFCTDASPYGAGICRGDLPREVVKELWRHGEQRGYYTALEAPATATLRELGLETEAFFGSVEVPAPERLQPSRAAGSQPLLFDYVELFGRDANWAPVHANLGLRAHPGTRADGSPLDLHKAADFRELAQLAADGVIREWHFDMPSLSFCTWSRPRLRAKFQPSGFDSDEPRTGRHNRLARRVAFLCAIIATGGGYFSVEQPGASVMFHLHCFRALVSLGAVVTRLCSCSFGSPFKRPLQWLHNKPWLCNLGGPCNCKKPNEHMRCKGSFTPSTIELLKSRCKPLEIFGQEPQLGETLAHYSGRHPLPLLQRIASGSLRARHSAVPTMPLSVKLQSFINLGFEVPDVDIDFAESDSAQPRSFHDDPEWISDLAESVEFKELLRYKFSKTGHINVLECRAYKTWVKWAARHHPMSRLLCMLDSRVLLGAAAKGRSSSLAITRVLQGALPYILGSQLYPAGLHVYSAQNRSDGPSRWKPVPGPTKPLPRWLEELIDGDTFGFDVMLASASVPKLPGRWLRLLLLLGGDIERNPGPSPSPRGPLDLQSGFVASTRHKMQKAFSGFLAWLQDELRIDATAVLSSSESAALALRGYGLYLYEAGHPRYLLVYAITAVQDAYPAYRSQLTPAWQIDKKWQAAEPGECRPVISQPILQAAIALAVLWNWTDWAAVTLLGFLCMLHPTELIFLTRGDLVFPADALSSDRIGYVHIKNPKTARFARRQHCRFDDQVTLEFLEALFLKLPWSARLFRGSLHMYRKQWNAIMTRLGVPCSLAQRGATPGVLRGSGATFLYLETEDLPFVAWRGRWAKVKTVEFYLQEVAAQLLLQRLSQQSRRRIETLSRYARALLLFYAANVGDLRPSNAGLDKV